LRTAKQILIDAKRIENVPGTHSVVYNSAVDAIEIKHTAHNREGFALGRGHRCRMAFRENGYLYDARRARAWALKHYILFKIDPCNIG
jgi:dihydrodipicolinate reductase